MRSHFTHGMSDSLRLYLWSTAHQSPLSMGFSRQDYWSGLPFPSPGDLPNPRMEPESLKSPVLTGRFFTISTTWNIIGLILCLTVLICILLNINEADPHLKWVVSLLTCLFKSSAYFVTGSLALFRLICRSFLIHAVYQFSVNTGAVNILSQSMVCLFIFLKVFSDAHKL